MDNRIFETNIANMKKRSSISKGFLWMGLLLMINLLGYAWAKSYFQAKKQEPLTEYNSNKQENTKDAKIINGTTLVDWSLNLLRYMRQGN